MAFKRRKMGYRKSKRNFKRHSGFKKKNYQATPMRGGFRI
jgi:hypothetical protein